LLWPAAPELSDRLAAAGVQVQRRIASMLTERAMSWAPSARSEEILRAVRAGEYGDSQLRRALRQESDTAQRAALRADESGDVDTQRRMSAMARAAGVAYYALDEDPEEASQGAAYESLFLGEDNVESLLADELDR
jgi:hypothetical protein